MAVASPAVISIIGRDQKGVVARVSTYLASHNVNIENIEQSVMEGLFIMTMLVDLADLSISLDQLVLDLKAMGGEIDAIVHEQLDGGLDADLVGVLSNHQDLAPVAEHYNLPFRYHPSADKTAHFEFVMRELDDLKPDVIVLARYMQILPTEVVRAYPNRIINIHPSLLPYYPGANAYKQAYEAGVRVCGCTAHFVTEDLDEGPVILQDVFHIRVGEDSLDDVKRRGQELEADVLVRALAMFVREERVVADSKVLFRPGRVA
jgi:formyltetrahydrofolate deformylase